MITPEKITQRWNLLCRKDKAIDYRHLVASSYGPSHVNKMWQVLKRSGQVIEGIDFVSLPFYGHERRLITRKTARFLAKWWADVQAKAHKRTTWRGIEERRSNRGNRFSEPADPFVENDPYASDYDPLA